MSPTSSTGSSPVSLLQQHRPTLVTPLTSRPASPRHEDQPNPLETHELHCHQARGGMYAAQLKRAASQTPSTRSNSRIDCTYHPHSASSHPDHQCLLCHDSSRPSRLISHQSLPHPAVHDTSTETPPAVSRASLLPQSPPSRPNRSKVDTLSSDATALSTC
jgi:hypothetical protein